MKNYTYLLILTLIWCCSPKVALDYQRTGKVNVVSFNEMTLTLVSESQGATFAQAADNAERQLIENLLFKGIPESNQEQPLIDNERNAWLEHDMFLQKLIIEKGYMAYVTDSRTARSSTYRSVSIVRRELTLDLRALRKSLEEEKIIRKFGL